MLGQFVVNIEIVGTCNLKCPSCPVGNYADAKSPGSVGGTMPLPLFDAILDKLSRELKNRYDDIFIALYSWGEPLIHPQIGQLVARTKAAGFRVGLSSNLNYQRNLEQALAAEPDEFVVSLSGFSQPVYTRGHAGGNAEVVKDGMRRMSGLLRSKGYRTEVYVHYHSYRHTTGDDIVEMARLCEELGFGFIPGIAYYMPVENMIRLAEGQSLVRDAEIIDQLLVPIPEQLRIAAAHASNRDCDLINSRMDIDVDGSVKLCCSSYERTHNVADNVLETDFDTIQARRNQADLCGSCLSHGIQRIYTLKDYGEWQQIANDTLANLGRPLRYTPAGVRIEGVESESLLLSQAIETMNSGDLMGAATTKSQLDALIARKYGQEVTKLAATQDRIDSGRERRGVDIPVDPLRYYFVEAVLLRNSFRQPGEAQSLLGQLLRVAQALSTDRDYAPTIAEMTPIITDWGRLPV